MDWKKMFETQRAYYQGGATQSYEARRRALDRLLQGLEEHEDKLLKALQQDLGKAPFEGYMSEIGMVREELHWHRRHLKKMMRPRRVSTPLAQFPSRSFRSPHPRGLVLVMAPWNYPVQLSLSPLVGAVAAGNCVVLKPSNDAPHTAQAMANLLRQCFDPGQVAVVLGGRAENQALLDLPFDHIFFTGGETVGRLVLEKAARHLTPVTLELGGKSPCIVAKDADLSLAARRIVFGKFLNAGQTCVAPDYLLVDRSVMQPLLDCLEQQIRQAFGEDPLRCPEYPRIVNDKHFERLRGLLEHGTIRMGGRWDAQQRRIEPTMLVDVRPDDPVMQQEIFGPLLPVLPYDTVEQAIRFVADRPHPLALYLFTQEKSVQQEILEKLQFGGGCINDTIIHLATTHMPFGGVGRSGMGAYHGQASFDTFTHYRSIMKKATWLDLPVRYHPYTEKKETTLRRVMR